MKILRRADKLAHWLVSYAACMDLICIGIRAGNHAVCGCSSLAELHRQYRELLPGSSRDALDLAICHRGVMNALCRLRESRNDLGLRLPAETELRICRKAHDDVLTRMLASLTSLHVGRRG